MDYYIVAIKIYNNLTPLINVWRGKTAQEFCDTFYEQSLLLPEGVFFYDSQLGQTAAAHLQPKCLICICEHFYCVCELIFDAINPLWRNR